MKYNAGTKLVQHAVRARFAHTSKETPFMKRPFVLRTFARFAILSLLALVASTAMGQVTSGTIFGTVKDPSGAYVSNARVTVHSDTVGAERSVTTNDRGDFVVPNMPPSTYTLTIDA